MKTPRIILAFAYTAPPIFGIMFGWLLAGLILLFASCGPTHETGNGRAPGTPQPVEPGGIP